MKTKLINELQELGIIVCPKSETTYEFDYEGLHMAFIYDEADPYFLMLVLPNIYEIGDREDERTSALSVIANLTTSMKYVKSYLYGNNVNLSYERLLLGSEELKVLLQEMIVYLQASYSYAFMLFNGSDTNQ